MHALHPNNKSRNGSDGPTSLNLSTILSLSIIAAISAYLLAVFVFADIEKVVHRVPDDAAYFFRIAENITSGNGPTFDGIHQTNGYHPLWLMTILPVAAVTEDGSATAFRAYLVLQIGLLFMASWLLFSRFMPTRSLFTSLLSSILFAYAVIYKSANGMESALLVLSLVVLFLTGWRFRVFSRFNLFSALGYGVLLGMVMLTRLDMVFLGIAVSGFCLAQVFFDPNGRSRAIWRLVFVTTGATLVVLPYLLYNLHNFGAFVPISGSLKSSFPAISFTADKFRAIGPLHLPFLLFAVVYVPWCALRLIRNSPTDPRHRYLRCSLLVLGVYVLLHAVNLVLFIDWGIFRWQFIPYALFLAMALREPTDYVLERWPKVATRVLVSVLIVLVSVVAIYKISRQTLLARLDHSWHVQAYRAALWTRANTQPMDVLAMKDAGRFAYFSRRKVINLDGVVNNAEYQEVLRSGSLNEYLARNGVKYIVQQSIRLNDENLLKEISGGSRTVSDGNYETIAMRYRCLKYDTHSEPLVLHRDDEVYKSPDPRENETHTFVIWRYR
ncbi:MAG: hypothetical protein JSW58_06945 [Candidatus Latescibacterota bacterium]|nr:MAG: hypothetical protein JSW58_06945 [Candidatus Latescibacterota bacterium]